MGARSWGAQSIREGLREGAASAVMAGTERQAPSGFALWRTIGDDAELLTIGVSPAARRAGVGAALVAAVLDASRRAGARRVLLEVDADNKAARALYRRAGFRQTSVRAGYYRDGADALVMETRL